MSKPKVSDLKEELLARLEILNEDVNKTQEAYNQELIELAQKFGENLESRAAKKEMQRIAKIFAEITVSQEEQIREIEGLLTDLDNASYE